MSITPPIAPPIAPNLASRDYFPNAWLPSQYPCELPEEERCLTSNNWRAHTPLPGPCAFLRWIPQRGHPHSPPTPPGLPYTPHPIIHARVDRIHHCLLQHTRFLGTFFGDCWCSSIKINTPRHPPSLLFSLLTRLLLRLIDHEPSFLFILVAPLASSRVVVDSTHDRKREARAE
jgi:hypothetical protein